MMTGNSEVINKDLIETCDPYEEEIIAEPFNIIIAGGAGDLSQRKLLPTLLHLYDLKKLPSSFNIIGFGYPVLTIEEYHNIVLLALKKNAHDIFSEELWLEFKKHITYISGEFEDTASFDKLKDAIFSKNSELPGKIFNNIYYMAVPPDFFPVIIKQLGDGGFNTREFNPRIIIEKPFGHDLESARELNRTVSSVFREDQIYRIDHYLGKETVQNIIFFRFSNSIFEPLWNRRYIDNVQITVAEDIGIGHRGSFYEKATVIRDIIQNHMMQLIALVAMEPPAGFKADLIRNERVKVFNSLRIMDNQTIMTDTVRGQYGSGIINNEKTVSYRNEKDVSQRSGTPTFFAAKLFIDNWRWANVPFYVRSGKRLKRRVTEIVIQFKQPPLRLFGRICDTQEPSSLILTIQPEESINLKYNVKMANSPNRTHQINMKFSYNEEFNVKTLPPYSRLLLDCFKGDPTLFVRQDGIEAMWSFIDPINRLWENTEAQNFPNYQAGSWGPIESDLLLAREGRRWVQNDGDNYD